MRAPDAHGAAIPLGPARPARRHARRARLPSVAISSRGGLAIVAVTVLAASLAIVVYGGLRSGPAAQTQAVPGTAFLGTATCADWRSGSVARRMTIIGALGVAATQPDPENPGATLDEGAAYGLFQRACSTRLSRSFLLYEVYNRAASFQAVRGARAPLPSHFAHP
jgi:hypothetical protein